MLKHLVTPKCPRHCDYCIAKNMRHPQVVNMRRLKEIYELMRQKGYVDIMLSGGEPTIAEGFTSVLTMAFAIFNNVYLTTADRIWVEEVHARHSMISAITFSVHDLGDLEQFDVVVDTGGVPV
jgi:molybdenum cofactor biosynthesis enzyme MoaA